MPSIVTHYLFSEDVKNSLSNNIAQKLNQANNIYHIFAQSFDNLFYYNLLNFKSGKKVRKFGNTAQREHINDYFKNMILSIKELKMEQNPEALAYLYGSLTHYLLDSTCHPFIIFQAGWIDEENPNYEYRGNHEKIEVTIDAIYWQEKKKRPLYKESLSNLLLPHIKFSKDLINLIGLTYEKTFQKKDMGKIYETSLKQGHYIIKFFVTDHYGIKKTLYKIFDFIFQKNYIKYQNLSFYQKSLNKEYLNRTHNEWCNPVNNKLRSFESFDDLYQKALQQCIALFQLTEKVLQDELSLETYLEYLKDKSYTTGLDWHDSSKIRFFKKNNHESLPQ